MNMEIIQTNNDKLNHLVLNADSKDELFGLFFRKCQNKYKYCHSVSHRIIDEQLRAEYKEWISDISNYANSGGDMW